MAYKEDKIIKMKELENFFNPKIAAIIGASDHEKKVGGVLMKKALASKCRAVPVNPSHDYIFGKKCYKNLLEIPWKIDLAVIAIPAQFVAQALEECGIRGVKNAIIISAGFAETGNLEGQEKILDIAEKHKIRILGPNCFGVFNPENNLDLTFSATTPSKKGHIAFLSQSGALWSYASDFCEKSEKPVFSGFASLGNMADLEFSNFIDYFSKDEKTKALVLYIEKLKDGRKFLSLCKNCIKSGKKIFAVKAGKTAKGSEAAVSHTASLATDYEIYKGAFKQAGVVLCEGLIEAFERAGSAKLLEKNENNKKIKISKQVSIITNAGGAGALLSDYLSEKGFEIQGKVADILGTASAEDYIIALEKSGKQENSDSIIVILTPQSMSEIKETAEAIADFSKNNKMKRIVALFLGGKSVRLAKGIFEKNNTPFFNTLEEARENLVF